MRIILCRRHVLNMPQIQIHMPRGQKKLFFQELSFFIFGTEVEDGKGPNEQTRKRKVDKRIEQKARDLLREECSQFITKCHV